MDYEKRKLLAEQVTSFKLKIDEDGFVFKKNVLAEDGSGWDKLGWDTEIKVRDKIGDVFYTRQDIEEYRQGRNMMPIIPKELRQNPMPEEETIPPEKKEEPPKKEIKPVKRKNKKVTPEVIEKIKSLLKERKTTYEIVEATGFSTGALYPHFKRMKEIEPKLFEHIKPKK